MCRCLFVPLWAWLFTSLLLQTRYCQIYNWRCCIVGTPLIHLRLKLQLELTELLESLSSTCSLFTSLSVSVSILSSPAALSLFAWPLFSHQRLTLEEHKKLFPFQTFKQQKKLFNASSILSDTFTQKRHVHTSARWRSACCTTTITLEMLRAVLQPSH